MNRKAIVEVESTTYTDGNEMLNMQSVCWNHGISEILNSIIGSGLKIDKFNEYDYSPYDCFNRTVEFESGKYRIKHFGDKIPMVYALSAHK